MAINDRVRWCVVTELTEMERAFLLDIVVGKGTTVLELLASEDQALLVGRNSFLVLDLGFDVIDGVRRLNLKGDRLSCEDLHATAETKNYI